MPETRRKTIVFAGGGHAHLYSLRRTKELVDAGFDVVLINPSRFLYYSGMAPGLLSRIYRPEGDRIDVRYLVEKGGGRFVQKRITRIHSETQEVELDDRERIHYDAMTLCLGSGVPSEIFAKSAQHLTPVKPVENMENLHWRIRGLKDNENPRVLVIGGGPAGCEMACNAQRVFDDHGIPGTVTIVNSNEALLKSAPRKAQRMMLEHVRRRGVEVMLGSRIERVEADAAYTADGRRIEFDILILAVGIKPPAIFRESGLKVGPDDGLWINEHLQSVSDPQLFGGGDSVAFQGEALTRLGVFAIRQGPVIFHNLQAFLNDEPLQEFKPQPVFLYILNLGNEEGLAIWGKLVWAGRWAWKLKNYIDVTFMKTFQYPEDEPGEAAAYFERLDHASVTDVGSGIDSAGALKAATGGSSTPA